MLEYKLLLEQFLQRKMRALRSNDKRRQAFHCSTCSGRTRPSNVPGACQFFLNMLIEPDGSVIVTESFLQHTACTTETNYAAKRHDLTLPDCMVEADAAYVASYGKCRSQYKALDTLIGRSGYEALHSTIKRSLAKANSTHCYEHNLYARIAGFADASMPVMKPTLPRSRRGSALCTGTSALIRYERNELEYPEDIIQSKEIEKQNDRTSVFLCSVDLQLLFCCFSNIQHPFCTKTFYRLTLSPLLVPVRAVRSC